MQFNFPKWYTDKLEAELVKQETLASGYTPFGVKPPVEGKRKSEYDSVSVGGVLNQSEGDYKRQQKLLEAVELINEEFEPHLQIYSRGRQQLAALQAQQPLYGNQLMGVSVQDAPEDIRAGRIALRIAKRNRALRKLAERKSSVSAPIVVKAKPSWQHPGLYRTDYVGNIEVLPEQEGTMAGMEVAKPKKEQRQKFLSEYGYLPTGKKGGVGAYYGRGHTAGNAKRSAA